MNTKSTWLLVLVAFALAVYCLVFEMPRPVDPMASKRLLPGLQVSQVTRVELVQSNLTLRAEQKGDAWVLTSPVAYPARKSNIEALVQACQRLEHTAIISAAEVRAQPRGLASYGLEPPLLTLKFEQGAQSFELRIGTNAPVDKLLYVQLAGSTEVQVVNSDLGAFLPRTLSDWRDLAFINLTGVPFNRLEMRPRSSGFEVMLTNQSWRMTWPIETRADTPGLNGVISQIRQWPVVQFFSDDPKLELEPLGLQPPEAELAIGMGTNDAVVVQFGRSPTNYPGLVFARRLSHTNVVLVPRGIVDQLRRPHTAFRDRRLLTFDPAAVDTLEVQADEKFAVVRQPTNNWQIVGATNFPGDPVLVRNFLGGLTELEVVEFDSFVVTDFAKFGLSPPARQYALKTSQTNGTGGTTNRLLVQLDLGGVIQETNGAAKVYARRTDETALYQLSLGEVQRLPRAAYQLRDRRLWNFTTNQVVSVTSVYQGKATKILRSPEGVWSLATPGMINNTLAVEEAVHRLGELRVVSWLDRGADRAGLLGITDTHHKLAIEVLVDGQRQMLVAAFGNRVGNLNVAASTYLDGQVIVFEFPQKLYDETVAQWLTFP